MATKLDTIVRYHKGLPPINPTSLLITWFLETMWQTKNIISPPFYISPECLCPPKLTELEFNVMGFRPQNYITLGSCGLERSRIKVKP